MGKKPRILGRQVHQTLFGTEVIEAPQDAGKGRNQETLAKRDERFAYRYEFYTRVRGVDYTRFLELLAQEFDLRVYTAGWLVSELADQVAKARKEALEVKELRKRYWWMEWDVSKLPILEIAK